MRGSHEGVSMSDEVLAQLIERARKSRVLVIGDLMLDRFVYGSADRVSPEAPIPVLAVAREQIMLGGAGNVARNVAALGGQASLIGVVGDDEAGSDVIRLLMDAEGLEASLVTVPGRPTTLKTRYVAGSQQLLRADHETTEPVSAETEQRLIERVIAEMEGIAAVIISDYAKGVLTPGLITAVVAAAKAAGRPVVADPKGLDFTRYRGVTVLKPNARELAAATGMPVRADEEAEAAGNEAIRRAEVEALLVTRSERGMSLMRKGEPALHLAGRAREVFDVSGAGDTALAMLALALAADAQLPDAAALANLAAGIAVGKVGTALVYTEDLIAALQSHKLETAEAKILPLTAVTELAARWRARGLRVGFTNGCFDLIHPGHVSLLAQARAACDRLVVGLNADSSVKRLKGEGRPVNTELARAVVLASLVSVDAIVLFEEDTPLRLIEALRPEVLVKGADYTVAQVVGADIVQSYGGKVMLAELRPGHSTTGTIARLVEAQKAS
jgi:D-beta-D-heptose 7-phosphate kinase/D-beta-D-heptose 1-phosphate adenosyltransferase